MPNNNTKNILTLIGIAITIAIVLITLFSGMWANSRVVPEIKADVVSQGTRITIVETDQRNMGKDVEELQQDVKAIRKDTQEILARLPEDRRDR